MNIIYQIVFGIMIVIMDILLVALLIVGGGVCLYTWFQKKKKRVDWNKMYDNIQRGDLFIENLHESDPYRKQWGRKVEIIDKRVNNEGIPYIKYLELDCPFESTDSTKLCHWMIRHTYTYRLEETGEKDWIGRPEQRKVWDEKIVLPRWQYVLTWMFCVLLAPLAIVAPIVVGSIIGVACSDGGARFVYTNRFIEWLKKEV